MERQKNLYYNKVLRALVCVCACAIYVLGLSGCEEPVEKSYVEIPIQFSLPAEQSYADKSVHRVFGDSLIKHIPGDPGTTESLDRPTRAYVFVVFHFSNSTHSVSCVIDTTLVEEKWLPRRNSNGDSILVYSDRIKMELPAKDDKDKTADVYIAVSSTPLTLKNGENVVTRESKTYWPTTEDEVKNIKFVVNDAMQPQLQHIYSSPYNHKLDGSTYYGHLTGLAANVPTIHMMLYHVASKVDLMWNVPTDKQKDLRVTEVKAKNLFKGDAYLFKPTAISHAAFTDETGYTPSALATDAPGTWWAGRKYFYTMAYQASDDGNKFILRVDFKVRNMNQDGNPEYTYGLTMKKSDMGDAVFAPWMRGKMTVSDILTENKTKTVEITE